MTHKRGTVWKQRVRTHKHGSSLTNASNARYARVHKC